MFQVSSFKIHKILKITLRNAFFLNFYFINEEAKLQEVKASWDLNMPSKITPLSATLQQPSIFLNMPPPYIVTDTLSLSLSR